MQTTKYDHASDSYLLETTDHSDPMLPDKRLCLAMLEIAIKDLVNGKEKHQRQAAEWMDRGNHGAISFWLCCSILNFSPRSLRSAIERFKANYVKPKNPQGGVFAYRRRSFGRLGTINDSLQ